MAFFNHAWENCLRNDERSVQVYIDNLTEFLGFHFEHWNSFDDSCIVYENIDYTDIFLNLFDCFLNLSLVSNVADISMNVSDSSFFVIFKTVVELFLSAVIENNFCACGCISLGDSKTDAIRSTSNPSNFTSKVKIFHFEFCHVKSPKITKDILRILDKNDKINEKN